MENENKITFSQYCMQHLKNLFPFYKSFFIFITRAISLKHFTVSSYNTDRNGPLLTHR